jgi:hypothetical protein
LDTLRLPRPYRSLNWEHLAQHSELRHNEPLTQVEPPKPSGALHIAQLYMEHLFRWFGLPQKIISNRDPCFTSHFAQELTKGLGISQNLSTAFHPQTDGLSERTNQWVEQYLCLITTNQNEWSKWLPMATTVHNNSRNSTTGFAPSELLVGWEPPLSTGQCAESKNQTAEEYLTNLHRNRLMAIHALNRTDYKTNVPSN